MLFLVGIGLAENDLSIGAIEACRRSELYLDAYTSFVDQKRVNALSKSLGREIKLLKRPELEENARELVSKALKRNIAILVGGDPLIATTHKILYIEAKRAGIRPVIIHAASVFTAAMGESGLDFYRFGPTCTIPKWSEHYKPVSFYNTIQNNIENGKHSMLLLDYDAAEKQTIPLAEAVKTLESAESHYKKNQIKDSTKLMVLHNIAMKSQKIIFTTIKGAKKIVLNRGPTLIIIPAKLTDIETEIIKSMHKNVW